MVTPQQQISGRHVSAGLACRRTSLTVMYCGGGGGSGAYWAGLWLRSDWFRFLGRLQQRPGASEVTVQAKATYPEAVSQRSSKKTPPSGAWQATSAHLLVINFVALCSA